MGMQGELPVRGAFTVGACVAVVRLIFFSFFTLNLNGLISRVAIVSLLENINAQFDLLSYLC